MLLNSCLPFNSHSFLAPLIYLPIQTLSPVSYTSTTHHGRAGDSCAELAALDPNSPILSPKGFDSPRTQTSALLSPALLSPIFLCGPQSFSINVPSASSLPTLPTLLSFLNSSCGCSRTKLGFLFKKRLYGGKRLKHHQPLIPTT